MWLQSISITSLGSLAVIVTGEGFMRAAVIVVIVFVLIILCSLVMYKHKKNKENKTDENC